MSYAPQSSPGLLRLPACLLAICITCATPAAAQEETALAEPAQLHKDPDGVPLVTLPAGTEIETGRAKGEWHEATVEGWIFTRSTARTRRDGFDLVVTAGRGENLRERPNGTVIGRVRSGTLLERVESEGGWSRVRRVGWIPNDAVATKPVQGTPAPAQQPATPRSRKSSTAPAGAGPAEQSGSVERLQTARETTLGAAADGGTIGTLQTGTPAEVVARVGDRVKVRVEGWVAADALVPGDSGVLTGVSAAEVRSTPGQYVGRTVEWRLQTIAVKRADELRPEMAPDQPYLLTRGPLPEPGFVYVVIPEARMAEFQALPPLQDLVLLLDIRAAHTKFLETPVTELVSVVSGMNGK